MNKRIKRKVAKRIINKIGTENLLTDFERKYFIKFFWKPLKNEVTSIIEVLKIEEELVKEKIEELSVAEETAVEQMDWLENNVLSQPVRETKWHKAKSIVKGWFGK